MAARARRHRVRHGRCRAGRDLARDYGESARRGEPTAIRLNYGMQRVRGGGNAVRAIACLPALDRRLAAARRGLAAVEFRQVPGATHRAGAPGPAHRRTPRTINMNTIGDDLLRPASAEFGPAIEALIVYNSNPVAVAPTPRKVVQGFAREDLFTVVLEHFQTDTADYADYLLPATTQLEHWDVHLAYGHTDVLLNRPAIAPLGEAKPNTPDLSRAGAAHGLHEPCFADRTTSPVPHRLRRCGGLRAAAGQGFASLRLCRRALRRGPLPHAVRPLRVLQRAPGRAGALDGLPDHVPNYEAPGSSTQFPLAMISPPARNFLNSTFVNVQSLRDIEGEPLLEMHTQRCAGARPGHPAAWCGCSTSAAITAAARKSPGARPGVVNGLGIWWRKLGLDGHNVNQLTSQRLTDMGRAPTFYDCLVQYFVIFFFNAALVGAAMIRLDGGTPTLSDGLRLAASKWVSILGYAAIAATVGMVLRAIAERVGFLGRIVTGLLGAGWTIATFLVVPVLVARDVGPVDAVKESALILKRTWGENLVGQAGLGVAFALVQFLVVVLGVALVLAAANSGSAILIVLTLVLAIGAVLLSILVHGALSGIYAAALYRFATQDGASQGFDTNALRSAFVVKGA
jgi:hypothetical protein